MITWIPYENESIERGWLVIETSEGGLVFRYRRKTPKDMGWQEGDSIYLPPQIAKRIIIKEG